MNCWKRWLLKDGLIFERSPFGTYYLNGLSINWADGKRIEQNEVTKPFLIRKRVI